MSASVRQMAQFVWVNFVGYICEGRLALDGFIAIAPKAFCLLRPTAKLIAVHRFRAVGRYQFGYREPVAINHGPARGHNAADNLGLCDGKIIVVA